MAELLVGEAIRGHRIFAWSFCSDLHSHAFGTEDSISFLRLSPPAAPLTAHQPGHQPASQASFSSSWGPPSFFPSPTKNCWYFADFFPDVKNHSWNSSPVSAALINVSQDICAWSYLLNYFKLVFSINPNWIYLNPKVSSSSTQNILGLLSHALSSLQIA